MKIELSNNVRILKNKNAVVLVNAVDGKWIRLPQNIYDIFIYIFNNEIDINNIKEILPCCSDQEFVQNIYEKLYKLGIVIEKGKENVISGKFVSFEMTHRCNLQCIHCCIDADGVANCKEDLNTNEIKVIYNKVIDWKPERIMLSGGECMLREDFTDLLIYLRKRYNGKIIVSTNGTLINEKNCTILSKCADKIDISLDGTDEESCSIVRGKGVFNKVLQSVKLLQNEGFKNITLSMVVADKNEYLEEKFNKLNKSLGTKPLIRFFFPTGRGKVNKKVFTKLNKDDIYIPNDFYIDNKNKFIKARSCSAGKREIFIKNNGDVYPCPNFIRSENLLGNILDIDSLDLLTKNIINDIQEFNKIEQTSVLNNEKCKNCIVNLFCCTCPALLETYTKKQFENYCNKVRPILIKRIWG